MAVNLTYPGVYVEEIGSEVRTIAGVATSVTAFVGRAIRGPVNVPVVINSFGDFEKRFGGLWNDSTMSFAVRDYFMNGGSQAVIVRLFSPTFATESARQTEWTAAQAQATTAATAVSNAAAVAVAGATTNQDVADAATAAVAAASAPGAAAAAAQAIATVAQNAVAAATVPQDVADATSAAIASTATTVANAFAPVTRAQLTINGLGLEAAHEGVWGNLLRVRIDHNVVGSDAANLFNISIKDGVTGTVEVIRNVSIQTSHVRRVDNVMQKESQLIRVLGSLPGTRPTASTTPSVGADPFGTTTSTGVTTPASDGNVLTHIDYLGSETNKTGIYALADADIFNILCIPPFTSTTDVHSTVWAAAATYCEKRRAILIVDSPSSWLTKDNAVSGITAGVGMTSKNASLYFPRIMQPNILRDNQIETFAPCGTVAGVIARTDSERGVWKAPAGLDAVLKGVPQLRVALTDSENGELNPLGVNCLRNKPPAGRIIWGARTLQGDDRLASEWKYLSVRRTALYIEECLFRGTQWIVFEPNDEALWSQIRLNVGTFMHGLFRRGAFQGSKPSDAYLVKCDSESTTQDDINRGIVNIVVGFAPLKPAEFVVIKLQQLAGQLSA
jgi:phage tail sheath protein FI